MAAQKAADLKTVLEALKGLSHGVGLMFSAGLPLAVEPSSEQRHAFQAELVTMVVDELRQAFHAAEQDQASTAAKVASEQALLLAIEARSREAAANEASAAEAVKAKASEHASAQMEAHKAEQNHAKAELTKTKADRKHAELRTVRDRVAFVQDGPLRMLCSGGWDDCEAQSEAIEAVLELLREVGAEDTLQAAMPAAFKVGPDARQAFDKVIEQGVVDVVAKRFAELEAELAEVSEDAEQISAETLGFWAIADVAREAAGVAAEVLSAAKVTLEEATQQRVQLENERAAKDKDVSQLLSVQALQEHGASRLAAAIEAGSRLRVDEYRDASSEKTHDMDVDLDVATSCAAEAKMDCATSDAPGVVAV